MDTLSSQLNSLVQAAVSAKSRDLRQKEARLEQREKMFASSCEDSDLVTFNVSGQCFQMSVAHARLQRGTYFEVAVSDRFKRKDDGSVFVDRDPETFKIILDYMTYQVLPESLSALQLRKLLSDCKFYGLVGLHSILRKQVLQARREERAGAVFLAKLAGCSGNGHPWRWTQASEAHDGAAAELQANAAGVQGCEVVIQRSGTYMVHVRLHGVSSNNGGKAELKVGDTTVAEAWAGNNNGYHRTLNFSEILQCEEGARLQVFNRALTHGYQMTDPTCGSFSVVPLDMMTSADDDDQDEGDWSLGDFESDESKNVGGAAGDGQESEGGGSGGAESAPAALAYATAVSTGCGGTNHPWLWRLDASVGKCARIRRNASCLQVIEAGTYQVFVRVPGTSSGNNGYAELRVNGAAVARAYSGDANGYRTMLCFNEVLPLGAGAKLSVVNSNLSHGYNEAGLLTLGSKFTVHRLA